MVWFSGNFWFRKEAAIHSWIYRNSKMEQPQNIFVFIWSRRLVGNKRHVWKISAAYTWLEPEKITQTKFLETLHTWISSSKANSNGPERNTQKRKEIVIRLQMWPTWNNQAYLLIYLKIETRNLASHFPTVLHSLQAFLEDPTFSFEIEKAQ